MTVAKDMTSCSQEEIFLYISEHLLEQNEKCASGNRCFYRFGQLMCAAGPLVSDDKYSSEMESYTFIDINSRFDLGYEPEQVEIITKLQIIHDNFPPEEWKCLLKLTAIENRFDSYPCNI